MSKANAGGSAHNAMVRTEEKDVQPDKDQDTQPTKKES